jgi:hypothetical protein
MFARIDTFVREVSQVETETALADLLAEVSRDMGFAYFALTLGHAPPPLTTEAVWTCATATRPRSEPASPSEVLTPRRRRSALGQNRSGLG